MDNKQNYYIDFLKFIFSLIIVFFHTWIFNGVFNVGIFNRGYYAVDFYYIVTGYLLFDSINRKYKKYDNNELGKISFKYLFNKVKGLLPYMFLSIIMGLIFVYGKNIEFRTLLSNNIVAEIFQLGFLNGNISINVPMWYLSCMFFALFIIFPLLLKYRDNYIYFIGLPIIFITIGLCNYMGLNINEPTASKFIFINGVYKALIFINLGVIAYSLSQLFREYKLNKNVKKIITILETLGYLFLILAMNYNICGSYVFGLGFTILVALTFSNQTLISGLFKSRNWKKLGKFGFVLYLNNYYLVRYLMANYNYSYNRMVVIYLCFVLVISILSYILIDLILPTIIGKIKNKLND